MARVVVRDGPYTQQLLAAIADALRTAEHKEAAERKGLGGQHKPLTEVTVHVTRS